MALDQELRAFLEEREARMDERFKRIDERFTRIDERFTGMDERLTGMDERFKQVETEVRHTRILVERLDGNIRLLAEGVVGTGERIDSLREETTGSLDEIKGTVRIIQETLIPRVSSLEGRVTILEGWKERENRDILEVVRERFGLHRA